MILPLGGDDELARAEVLTACGRVAEELAVEVEEEKELSSRK